MAPRLHISSGLFGSVGVERFLRNYWRKKPLLVRRAIADLGPELSSDALFDLAARDDVEARLVTRAGARWRLKHAPLAGRPRARRDWTLLVQGANLHFAALDRLMRRFAFVPFTRLDDVMVSFAVDGGGVGPHFDSYDVFLIQAQGRRRWQIDATADLTLVDDLPLKILRRFEAQREWVLEPGDMLYLPPHIAHDGVAMGDCMTYSVGFRAPTYTELGREFLLQQADDLALPGRFSDTTRRPVARPAQLDDDLLGAITRHLTRRRWRAADVTIFAGRFFSEPKAHVYFTPPARVTQALFLAGARRTGLRLDARSQLLYRARDVFINGEHARVSRASSATLARFANSRCLNALACGKLAVHEELARLLYDWYLAGWILPGGEDD